MPRIVKGSNPPRARQLRAWLRAGCLGLAAVVVLLNGGDRVAANQSPAGCNTNGINISLTKDKTTVAIGQSVTYSVSIDNHGSGSGAICDMNAVTIRGQCPNASGSPVAPGTILNNPDPVTSIPAGANGPADFIPPTTVSNFTCVIQGPAGGVAQAKVVLNGNLQDIPGADDFTTVEKPVSVNVVSENLVVTKACTVTDVPFGQPVTVSGTVTNNGTEDLANVTCTDSITGAVTLSSTSLAKNGGSATYSFSYVPAQPGPSVDTISCTGTGVDTGSTVNSNQATATCNTTPQLNLTTIATPSSAKVGDVLNDSAQLTGGVGPFSGTITFNLFDPDQASCSGTPRYTDVKNVSSTGSASTSPGFVADKPGAWQWTAHYSGDASHPAADSGCGSEPVIINGEQIPTLSEWGMFLFVALLVGFGSLAISRRRNITAG